MGRQVDSVAGQLGRADALDDEHWERHYSSPHRASLVVYQEDQAVLSLMAQRWRAMAFADVFGLPVIRRGHFGLVTMKSPADIEHEKDLD